MAQTPTEEPHNSLLTWNPDLGLWGKKSPGHTHPVKDCAVVHSGVESAVKLLALVQMGELDEDLLRRAVEGLLELQVKEGKKVGCFRWYAEESEPVDTNAAFFIILALQLLYLAYPDRIPAALKDQLRSAFERANSHFMDEIAAAGYLYPNKYLGDLVCAWLGYEILETPAPASLTTHFEKALRYWKETHWGWGEHLSDVYCSVLLTEFSALLIFAKKLPTSLRQFSFELAQQLCWIDDLYGSSPRVPQIRCYHFEYAPKRLTFRDQVAPWKEPITHEWLDKRAVQRYILLPFGPLFFAKGWTKLFPETPLPAGEQTLPAGLNADAYSWIYPDLTVGALTRWPIVEGAEHQGWGLSWQTFPVAFWHPEGDWGFMRFTVRKGQTLKAHPAIEKATGYLMNALGPGEPPPVGKTLTHPMDRCFVILRTLPLSSGEIWDEVTDGFWLIDPSFQTVEPIQQSPSTWVTLKLTYNGHALYLHHFADEGQPSPVLDATQPNSLKWTVSHALAKDSPSQFKNLWAITLDHQNISAEQVKGISLNLT